MPSVLDDPSFAVSPLPPPSLPLAPSAPAPAPPVPMRAFGDAPAIRQQLFSNVLAAARAFEPVTNQRYRLTLGDVDYGDVRDYSKAEQKRAILANQTLGRELRGTWTLTDAATEKPLASRRSRLGVVPYLTDRGTFIHRGNEYTMSHQLRLRAGPFARIKDNGELETHVNVAPGKGVSHRVFLDPKTGIFKLHIGQADIPIVSALRALGINDRELHAVWGSELAAVNLSKEDPKAVNKLYAKLVRNGNPGASDGEKREAIGAALRAMEIDPAVAKRTVAGEFKSLDKDAILAITKKLKAVSDGLAEPDDRDHLAFQTLFGPEDVFGERVARGRAAVRRALWKASATGKLDGLPTGILQKSFDHALLGTGLAQPLEEINPADLLDQQSRVTRMGEGGIPSLDAVPDDARAVQPSQFGYIDFLRTPESGRVGVDLRIARGARKGSDGRFYAPLVNVRTGKTEYRAPQDLLDAVVAPPGEMDRNEPMVSAVKGGRLDLVPRGEVDYVFPQMEDTFSPIGNLVPFKSTVKGQRAVMAARMLTQALPLVGAEAPLVQSAMPERPDRSFEEEYGRHMGAVAADADGVVETVSRDKITWRTADGERREVELYDQFPFNRKTLLTQTAVVQPGQRVTNGQPLARSNFTDDKGATALGLNARVAYIPFRGMNFEDAIVISASMAKRATSEHMYQFGREKTPQHRVGKAAFVSSFPSLYPQKLLDNFDDAGVIKPGTEVKYGDPLVLSLAAKEPTAAQLHRGRKSSFVNDTVTWDHHQPGIVTDAHDDEKGTAVIVKSLAQMEVGDKLSGRYGDKGVISAVVPDDEMPTDADGKPYEVLLNPYGVNPRTNPAQIFEAALGRIAAKTGKPYKIKDFGEIGDATEYVLAEMRKHGIPNTEGIVDPATGRRIGNVFTGNRWFMKLHHTAEGKEAGRGLGAYTAEGTPAKGGAQGCFAGQQKIDTIRGPMRISAICEKRLGVHVRTYSEETAEWVYRPVVDWFVYRASVADLLTIETAGGPCSRESRVNRTCATLNVTRNHVLLTPDGRRVAGDISVGDRLLTWGLLPTSDQRAFLYGTLLGDASVNSHYLLMEHSVKQVAYVAWKRQVLTGLCPEVCDTVHTGGEAALPSLRGRTHYGRQLRVGEDHLVHELRDACYSGDGGRKTVTPQWLSQLTGLSVAVWVLDDGSITNRAKKRGKIALSGNIAAHSFDAAQRGLLVAWLKSWSGETCSTNDSGQITLSHRICCRLIEEIATWVPSRVIPKSKKVVRRMVAAIQRDRPPRAIDTASRLARVPLRVVSVRPYVHAVPGVDTINVYDFTVADTHTYVAGHALVSNSKKIGMLELNALLSHGATEVARDASLVRGQASPEAWSQYMSGFKPPTPKVTHAYEKFVHHLKGAGINVVREGGQSHLMALTDRDVDAMAEDREITNSETVDWRAGLAPKKGGLFDETLTGGHGGRRWSFIRLHEPLPNPVMEEPICRVLGLTGKEFEDVVAGRKPLGGATGPAAVAQALGAIDLDQAIARARADIASGKRTARDKAVRRLGYLKAAQRLGVHPRDWMLSKAPVLPPAFRPVSTMGPKKLPLVADPNYLYKELFDANQQWRELAPQLDDVGEERLATYRALTGVAGLGDPIHPKNQERNVRGILKHIFGSSPKVGVVQRRLLGSSVDLVGRAVITPNPDLDMDQVAIPEDSAWEIYKPLIVRHLVRRGTSRLDAARSVQSRSAAARDALVAEMSQRPVIINRAPTLHRYGMMAAWPRLTKNRTLEVSPLVVGGFNADFDGDAMNYHVPATDEAAQEAADRMLPSRNLFAAANFRVMYKPSHEYTGGLYEATSRPDQQSAPRVFATKADAIRAYRSGEIDARRRIEILSD